MAFTDNDAFANALLDWIGDHFDGATLEFRTGAAPGANNAATGTVLASMTLPTPAMAAAASRAAAKNGTWQDPVANATGTIGHFRITSASPAGRVWEGTVTVTGGGGDITVNTLSANAGDVVTITAVNLTH